MYPRRLLIVQKIERETGTMAISDGNHSLRRVPEAALQFLTQAAVPMKQQSEIGRLCNTCPVEFLVAIESRFVKATADFMIHLLIFSMVGSAFFLASLNQFINRALVDFQREHLPEEIVYTNVG